MPEKEKKFRKAEKLRKEKSRGAGKS